MPISPTEFGKYVASFGTITYPGVGMASGSILAKTGAGELVGIFSSKADNTPTLIVYDNTTSSGTQILQQFTPAAATMYSFPIPIKFSTGLEVDSTGSVSCTVIYI